MVYRNSLYPARPAFQSNKQILDSGDYIISKGSSNSFCNYSCRINRLIGTNYNKLYALRNDSLRKRNICNPNLNNNDLNINLFTKMNLQDVTVINSKGIIDPYGVLFGNTECGMNNFVSFLVPNYPSKRSLNY